MYLCFCVLECLKPIYQSYKAMTLNYEWRRLAFRLFIFSTMNKLYALKKLILSIFFFPKLHAMGRRGIFLRIRILNNFIRASNERNFLDKKRYHNDPKVHQLLSTICKYTFRGIITPSHIVLLLLPQILGSFFWVFLFDSLCF